MSTVGLSGTFSVLPPCSSQRLYQKLWGLIGGIFPFYQSQTGAIETKLTLKTDDSLHSEVTTPHGVWTVSLISLSKATNFTENTCQAIDQSDGFHAVSPLGTQRPFCILTVRASSPTWPLKILWINCETNQHISQLLDFCTVREILSGFGNWCQALTSQQVFLKTSKKRHERNPADSEFRARRRIDQNPVLLHSA